MGDTISETEKLAGKLLDEEDKIEEREKEQEDALKKTSDELRKPLPALPPEKGK